MNIQEFLNKAAQRPDLMRDIMEPRATWGNRIEGSSFRRIPSVTSFEIEPGEKNTLLDGSGMTRKLKTKPTRKVHEGNNDMNKYIKFRIREMRAALNAGHPETFWMMVLKEMKYSTAFRLSCFNTVMHGWYKDKSLQQVYHILYGVNKILEEQLTELKYFRVEIPKGTPDEILQWHAENPNKTWDGKTRPLGVPTAPWRVVLHMWNGFFTLFLENEIRQYNHAFLPRSGTITALKEFAEVIPQAKFVYEFDLKGFFNQVSIHKVLNMLYERGMPLHLVRRFSEILIEIPKNIVWLGTHAIVNKKKAVDYDETLAKRTWGFRKKFTLGWAELGNKTSRGMIRWNPNSTNMNPKHFKGLPQGAGISPILSLLVLSEWYEYLKAKGIKLLMYADDGFLYSDQDFTPVSPPGIPFAEGKCKWLRREDRNISDTKFLGLRYDFDNGLFRGATKNGSTLEFGPDQLDLLKLISLEGNYSNLMAALVKSGIWGLVLSKLYNGSFGPPKGEPKAEYIQSSYWGINHDIIKLSNDRVLQRTASTISCEWLALQMEKSKGKLGRKALKSKIKDWENLEKTKIILDDLKAAVAWDDIWQHKNYRVERKVKYSGKRRPSGCHQ